MKTTTHSPNYNNYLDTYSGNALLEEHSLDEFGIWMIYGEDSNCDLGGQHYEPLLETVEGRLVDVIEYGVNLKSFWTWGGGGKFVKAEVKKIEMRRIW